MELRLVCLWILRLQLELWGLTPGGGLGGHGVSSQPLAEEKVKSWRWEWHVSVTQVAMPGQAARPSVPQPQAVPPPQGRSPSDFLGTGRVGQELHVATLGE